MFAVFFVLSVLAIAKLPKAHISKGIKPYLIGGSIAFTLFFACDILSLYMTESNEEKARIFFLAMGMFCVTKYLGRCFDIAIKKRKVRMSYEQGFLKELS